MLTGAPGGRSRDRAQARAGRRRGARPGRRIVITKDTTTIVDGAGESSEVEARVAQMKAEIEIDRLRLGPREAAGAAGQARRRRVRHQGRGGDRGGAEGEEAPDRGRRVGDPRGDRRGHHRRRRVRPRARGGCARGRPRARPATQATGCRWCGGALTSHFAGSPRTRGQEGCVVIAKVAEAGRRQGFNAATDEFGDLVAGVSTRSR